MALRAQILDGTQRLSPGMEGVAEAIGHLGYVQIDTISVVERAHHHVLWTRCPEYDARHLHDLQAGERRIFEYWAHAMAYLPMTDYRYFVPRMERMRDHGPAWLSRWQAEHGHISDDVLARIRAEGPLTSADFDPPPGMKRGTWWDWKPAKRALEILFWQGHLMITERRGFQKVYDLTERVLPADVDFTRPSDEELARFHIRRALGGLGLARAKEIRDTFHVVGQEAIDRTLEALVAEDALVALRIGNLEHTYYCTPAALERTTDVDATRILSPFDGLIIQRDRLRRLFSFEYTIECYVPASKRQYGYFVLPILWQGRFIGRMDTKAERARERLLVKGLWFEPGFDDYERALPGFAAELARFARFNACRTVEFTKVVPTGHKRRLKSLVRQALAAIGS